VAEIILPRRRFLLGLGAALVAAPAIVRATSLMAIRPLPSDEWIQALAALNERLGGLRVSRFSLEQHWVEVASELLPPHSWLHTFEPRRVE
jgi:hypothetical protein